MTFRNWLPFLFTCSLFAMQVDVSILAWQALEEGLFYASQNNHLKNIPFSWEPALKVNAANDFRECWDFDARWTYFHTHPSQTTHGPSLLIWSQTRQTVPEVHASWELNLNEFDFELGYTSPLSPLLGLRFSPGVKFALIDQHFQAFTTSYKSETIGAGPRIGFDSKWRLGKGFSLLAAVAGSLPLWQFRVRRSEDGSLFSQRLWIFRSILEGALGVGWEKSHFGVAANYEFQYFSEQNMLAMLVNSGVDSLAFQPRGDLHLHGAALTFHWGF